jgi:PTS system ascorbate-specific IIA component
MTALLVLAHAPLAQALVDAVHHVYSRDPCAASREVLAMDVAPTESVEGAAGRAQALLDTLGPGAQVLVLTDMSGATPGNAAARLARAGQVAVVGGVNLPMLLRAVCYSGRCEAAELALKAREGALNGVAEIGPQGTSAPAACPQEKN